MTSTIRMEDQEIRGESSSDIKVFDLGIFRKDAKKYLEENPDALELEGETSWRPSADPDYYDMSGRKLMVVFNFQKYEATKYYKYKAPTERGATGQDVKRIKEVFEEILHFEVVVHNDLNYKAVWEEILKLKKRDYSEYSCLSVAILTHGDKDGLLCAVDRHFSLDDVLDQFLGTLVGKPKLFFVQACRGESIDSGVRVSTDGDVYKLPSHCDFLILRSTVEDYLSYRDNRGSWLIQELCNTLQEHHKERDLLHIITKVNKKIAEDYYTFTYKYETHNKKQMPETRFTLTRMLKF